MREIRHSAGVSRRHGSRLLSGVAPRRPQSGRDRRSIRRIRLAPRPQGADRVPAAVAAVPPALLQKPRGAAWLGAMPAKSRPPKDESAETPHYHGHRERLRERFYNAGPDALSDYELLELALFAAIPRRDTKPL